MATKDTEKPTGGRPILIVLPLLILAGLLTAPPTRSLLQAQLRLLYHTAPFAGDPLVETLNALAPKSERSASLSDQEQKKIAAVVARFPNDYAIQLGGALQAASRIPDSRASTPQENYANFQREYGEPLAAVQRRFPNRPGPYAHVLREMVVNTVRVSREAEVDIFHTGKNVSGIRDSQIGYADSWAAFDQAAAQGEKLDSDNAYFPMMRAIGLFDAKRDAEGIAAILRAGQKTRFEDYSLEEPDSEWTLSLHIYGPSSMLVRQSIYATALLRHYAALRSLARLTAYLAAKAEQNGRIQDGLALRHAMMQCGSRIREQGRVTGALVGIAIDAIQTAHPGGGPIPTPVPNLTSDQRADRYRDRYLAYLHKIDAESEARWYAQLDATNRQTRALIKTAAESSMMDDAILPLPSLWTLGMLLLTNLVGMFLLSIAAIVCARLPKGAKALPVVVGALVVLSLLVAFHMQWAEALIQIRAGLNHTTLLSWDNEDAPGAFDLAGMVVRFPWVAHLGEVFLSVGMPALTLMGIGVGGALRQEKFAVSLSRGLRPSSLVLVTLLTVAYANTLFATARAEARFGDVLDGVTHQGVSYLKQQRFIDPKP